MARQPAAPIYLHIAETLEQEIHAGDPQAGTRLDSEAKLAARFDVNRHTVRQALALLQAKGLVHRVKGHGAFVTPGRLVYRIGRDMSFSNSVARLGLRNAQRIIDIAREPAGTAVADALALEVGAPVIRLRRVRYAGKIPFGVLDKSYPAERFAQIEERLREGFSSTRELLRRHYGVEVMRAHSSIEIEPADRLLANELSVKIGASLLRMQSLDVLPDHTPAEWGVTWFRGDATRIDIDVLPPHPGRS